MQDSVLKTIGVAVLSSAVTAAVVISVLEMMPPDSASGEAKQELSQGDTKSEEVRKTVREESRIIETVKNAESAVVSVIISKDLPVVEQYFEERSFPFEDFFGDPFFSPFDIQIPRYREKGTEKKEVGGGTAFFVSSDGLLMTNKHVVSDEEAQYTVLLNDGTKLPAEVVIKHPSNDIAFLQVEGNAFKALSLSEEEPQLGQTVIAIGNALAEFRNTVSVGVIAGLSRSITAGGAGGPVERLERIIQTDAAINRGNSGGPLLNLAGEVVGVNTAIAAGAQNVGFAIPAKDLKKALQNFQEHGRIIQAFLGIRYVEVTSVLKEKNQLPYDYGALILRGEEATDLAVVPGSPADKAGLTENDIILEADEEKLMGDVSLAQIVREKNPGDVLRLKVFHRGEEKELEVTLEEMK